MNSNSSDADARTAALPDREARRELRALGWRGKRTLHRRRARRPKSPRPLLAVDEEVPIVDLENYE